tara:strand:+ start:11948 stop:12634 length:687 start_codon:yes stop_codon:yes gene_type:complete
MESNNALTESNDLAPLIHQAALNPLLDSESLNQICDESVYLNFSGLCTSLIRLPQARKRISLNSKTKLIATISFPFGDCPNFIKKKQAEWAASEGAEELDIVPNLFALAKGEVDRFAEEIAELCQLGLPLRVILNAIDLPKEKLRQAINASIEAGAEGIQAGNGFGPRISEKQIRDIEKAVANRISIKAVGGIKELNHVIELINAGANHIGTSRGPEIIQQLRKSNQK